MSRMRAVTVPSRFGAAGFHRAVGEEQGWSWLRWGILETQLAAPSFDRKGWRLSNSTLLTCCPWKCTGGYCSPHNQIYNRSYGYRDSEDEPTICQIEILEGPRKYFNVYTGPVYFHNYLSMSPECFTLECFQALRSYIFWYVWKLQAQLLYWPIFSHEQLKLDSFLPPNMQNVNGEFYLNYVLIMW